MKWVLPILLAALWLSAAPSLIQASRRTSQSQLLPYAGKSYKGVQDPEYMSYDLALRDYLVKRIHKRFGIALDPKAYSGFDFLEIEALFKCKKSDEPFDIFLRMFPKHP